MSALLWFLRGILFIALLGLAIKNSADVELRFYFDARWQISLSLVVLASLVIGIALGLLALLPQQVRMRRRLSQLEKQLGKTKSDEDSAPPAVAVDG